MRRPTNIVFDLGQVLVGWDPQHLYQKIFDDSNQLNYFLAEVCPMDWNEEMDAGKPFAQGIAERIQLFPQYSSQILAYYDRWTEMLTGPIAESVDILHELHDCEYDLYAITNWSGETFPIAQQRYDFLDLFQDIVVSGQEGVAKPDVKIFQILIDRQQLTITDCVFIDDNLRNIKAAAKFGMHTIHFTTPQKLRKSLVTLDLL